MSFITFSKAVHHNYQDLTLGELFVTATEDLFAQYLAAFPAGTDPVVRTRTEHDCNTCKQFIRRLGGLVGLNADGTVRTVWDNLDALPHPYNVVAAKLAEIVRASKIVTVFRTKEREYGKDHNFDTVTHQRWDHLYGKVGTTHYASDPATKRGVIESAYQVLGRGLKELKAADLDTVLDLIDSNALYRGAEHRAAVVGFRDLLKKYDGTDNFVWANTGNRNALFRNTVIGTLLVDLAEGNDLEYAVKAFEAKVAPQNYKRPTAVITQRMVDDALGTIKDLGLEGAVNRRFARIGDVSVNNVLFVDRSVRPQMKGGTHDLKELLSSSVQKTIDPKQAISITVDAFVRDVLPSATGMGLLLQNKHLGNFVSLTGGDGPERLFRWDNNFAWSYDGEVTDSVKQRVKAAGGNVNALLRVSLSWSNYDDLDLHCRTPDGKHIYYVDKQNVLDVDMNAGGGKSRSPVENMAFTWIRDGKYTISVNNFCKRESVDTGFMVEVEFNGAVHQFSHGAVRDKQTVQALEIIVRGGQVVEIKPGVGLTGGSTPTEKWGVKTENLVPVSVMLNSPNHWDGQGVRAKHWFFMLKDCRNPDPVRGIYNEFLRPEFEKHRKVFEILGRKTKCQPIDDQLSGVGFSAARNDSVTVVVNGSRIYNITF